MNKMTFMLSKSYANKKDYLKPEIFSDILSCIHYKNLDVMRSGDSDLLADVLINFGFKYVYITDKNKHVTEFNDNQINNIEKKLQSLFLLACRIKNTEYIMAIIQMLYHKKNLSYSTAQAFDKILPTAVVKKAIKLILERDDTDEEHVNMISCIELLFCYNKKFTKITGPDGNIKRVDSQDDSKQKFRSSSFEKKFYQYLYRDMGDDFYNQNELLVFGLYETRLIFNRKMHIDELDKLCSKADKKDIIKLKIRDAISADIIESFVKIPKDKGIKYPRVVDRPELEVVYKKRFPNRLTVSTRFYNKYIEVVLSTYNVKDFISKCTSAIKGYINGTHGERHIETSSKNFVFTDMWLKFLILENIEIMSTHLPDKSSNWVGGRKTQRKTIKKKR